MFSPIIPLLLTITTLILTLTSILFGHNPSFGQDYAVLTIDMTQFGREYFSNASAAAGMGTDMTPAGIADLGISDWYALHVLTTCWGSYEDINGSMVGCMPISSYSRFSFLPLLRSALAASHTNLTLADLSFPMTTQKAIDDAFTVSPNLNLLLHVSFVFWVLGAIWTFLALVAGFFCFCGQSGGALALSIWPFTSAASTSLLIAASIATAVRDQGTTLLNTHSGETSIVASGGEGFIGVIWAAFVLSSISTVAWMAAGAFSAAAHFGD